MRVKLSDGQRGTTAGAASLAPDNRGDNHA